jgi:hypothetical protein
MFTALLSKGFISGLSIAKSLRKSAEIELNNAGLS